MAKFDYGSLMATQGIVCAGDNESFTEFVQKSLRRYFKCDWGEMCEEDIDTNNHALECGDRLFASYDIPEELIVDGQLDDCKIWIITELDRSVTTILFPSEY
jgi:hypothetical protein